MITFIVVGRNDGYGINLAKRTAISLNYFASLCAEPDDEIIYVDCNTPDHDLTLVESIADTLTPEARQRTKVYRITGQQMYGAIGETPLPFSDELSRNVAIRRSNPNNRWLLSTNCDVLVHPLGVSLQERLQKLEHRFYVCPRAAIPPAQWQMLNRQDPGQMMDFADEVIKQGYRIAPEKDQPWLRFSQVGDFQLAPRDQWFEIGGCEEGMKLWGHSDANNSRRLSILNGGGRTPDVGDWLRVLHLDHHVSVATLHEKVLVHNDWKQWVEEVTDYRSRNTANWGLADVELPLIPLTEWGNVNAKAILQKHRRPRRFIKNLEVKVRAKFWKHVSKVLNSVDKPK